MDRRSFLRASLSTAALFSLGSTGHIGRAASGKPTLGETRSITYNVNLDASVTGGKPVRDRRAVCGNVDYGEG